MIVWGPPTSWKESAFLKVYWCSSGVLPFKMWRNAKEPRVWLEMATTSLLIILFILWLSLSMLQAQHCFGCLQSSREAEKAQRGEQPIFGRWQWAKEMETGADSETEGGGDITETDHSWLFSLSQVQSTTFQEHIPLRTVEHRNETEPSPCTIPLHLGIKANCIRRVREGATH